MEEKVRKRLLGAKKLKKYLAYLPKQSDETGEIDGYLQQDPGKICLLQGEEEPQMLAMKEGCTLWICGYPALGGSFLLTKYHMEELQAYFPKRFLNSILRLEQLVRYGLKTQKEATELLLETQKTKKEDSGVTAIYPLGEGGLRRTIYELGKDTGLGFRIFYEAVPVKQESIEVCEFFDLDPWELASWGAFLLVAKRGWNPQQVWDTAEIPCRRIGYLTKDKAKLIVSNAGESGINRPAEDGLLHVLKRYC